MTVRHDPACHHRRSMRLKGYDYAQSGAYFITVCTKDRICLFGDADGDHGRLNEAGNMVATLWNSLPARFTGINLDEFVVMPNHVHGIIVLTDVDTPAVGVPPVGARSCVLSGNRVAVQTRAPTRGAPTGSLGEVVGAYKSLTTVEFVRGVKRLGWTPFAGRLWQRNYYEHVIRDDASLNRIRQYIIDNPAQWPEDAENPLRNRP